MELYINIIGPFCSVPERVRLRELNRLYYHTVQISDDQKHRYKAARIVYRTLLVWRAHHHMLMTFATRCMICSVYRDAHVYIHETDEPHICLREWPIWLTKNVYRDHMLRILPPCVLEEMSQHLNNALLNVNL